MRHRTYAGKIVYLTDGAGEMGRERFRVTVHDDGRRTLRAICEMDDDELLRDVTYTVDRHFRPLDAFVRLTIGEAFVGSGWYHFTETAVTCEAVTASAGGSRTGARSMDGRHLWAPTRSVATLGTARPRFPPTRCWAGKH